MRFNSCEAPGVLFRASGESRTKVTAHITAKEWIKERRAAWVLLGENATGGDNERASVWNIEASDAANARQSARVQQVATKDAR